MERWFGELTTSKQIRRGAFKSMADLQLAIEEVLNTWNEKPNRLYGRRQLKGFWRNRHDVVKLWKRSGHAVRRLRKARTNKASQLRETTLGKLCSCKESVKTVAALELRYE